MFGTVMVLLYSITAFIAASLLFGVQPLVGKMLLPLLGGVPAVWNTCMLFFQAFLLFGYVYAHLLSRLKSPFVQVGIHFSLLLVALVQLPIALRGDPLSFFSRSEQPISWLLLQLTIVLGVPFLLVSASAPLLQRWFSRTDHPAAEDPYFLYASSNAGSFAILLAYPLLVEPFFALQQQSHAWMYLYLTLVVLFLGCGVFICLRRKLSEEKCQASDAPLTSPQRCQWVLFSFLPSTLLLSLTAYLTTDLAPIPMLWLIPLALYLLTFVFVFAKRPLLFGAREKELLSFLILPIFVAIVLEATHPVWVLVPLHVAAFFVASMLCHSRLAQTRPGVQHLTEYYLWVSLGGVLGGVFNTILAPLFFDTIIEYPLALVAVWSLSLLDRRDFFNREHLRRGLLAAIAFAGGIFLLIFLAEQIGSSSQRFRHAIIFVPPAIALYKLRKQLLIFPIGLLVLIFVGTSYSPVFSKTLYLERNFFGVLRVADSRDERFRLLLHGNTLHGRELLEQRDSCTPTGYYHRLGPAGDILSAVQQVFPGEPVALVGLGAGELVCFSQAEQEWWLYEINPAVDRVARNQEFFSFLSAAETENAKTILGDARVEIQNAPADSFSLIVVDAFSSDSVPAHLITREAIELYLEKLRPGGMLAFHISNRYLRIAPVLAAHARDLSLEFHRRYVQAVTAKQREVGREPTEWVVITSNESLVEQFPHRKYWKQLPSQTLPPAWRDDFYNILSVMKW